MKYTTFEHMPVWQNAMNLAVDIHGLTERLPRKEDYGLTSQIRRSGLSISGNLAEGFGREHPKDKANFYYISRGSLCETKNHLIYGNRVGYFTPDELTDMSQRIESIHKELNSLTKAVRSLR